MTSYDVVRFFKRNLPKGYGKIGHFGTLDPFASGVLMIGVAGASRLNEFIHEYSPKTYLAVGKLGIETPTGDYTGDIIQRDESLYLRQEISRLPVSFLQERLSEKFVGDYLQAPHKYSATKFLGKNLHQWAREGVEVKKEPVLRQIYSFNIIKYEFPYISFEVTVSSGTYVRTLFTDICSDLGTIGTLISLVRSKVGDVPMQTALRKKDWPENGTLPIMDKAIPIESVLSLPSFSLPLEKMRGFQCGAFLKKAECDVQSSPKNVSDKFFWVCDETGKTIGMGEQTSPLEIRPKINFYSGEQSSG
jgi:tRNA pseudouridine55 synthase